LIKLVAFALKEGDTAWQMSQIRKRVIFAELRRGDEDYFVCERAIVGECPAVFRLARNC